MKRKYMKNQFFICGAIPIISLDREVHNKNTHLVSISVLTVFRPCNKMPCPMPPTTNLWRLSGYGIVFWKFAVICIKWIFYMACMNDIYSTVKVFDYGMVLRKTECLMIRLMKYSWTIREVAKLWRMQSSVTLLYDQQARRNFGYDWQTTSDWHIYRVQLEISDDLWYDTFLELHMRQDLGIISSMVRGLFIS